MFELVDSICEYGVLIPIIVRPSDNGRYEIISGHRRNRACEIAGLSEIPAFVFRLDDDEAAMTVAAYISISAMSGMSTTGITAFLYVRQGMTTIIQAVGMCT